MNRELKQLLRDAQGDGWTVRITGGGHLRLDPPTCCADRSPVFTASTPSDKRAIPNIRAMIRRRMRSAA